MSSLLWQKKATTVNERVQHFLAGQDVTLDRVLFVYDIKATAEHVRGLHRIGILTTEECEALTFGLDDLEAAFGAGTFELDQRFEDGHSAIEWYLTKELGETGKKVHLGRSRNDQVQVATRLYMRDALTMVREQVLECANACLARAIADEMTPMPGYTHLQRAVPSSIGLWMASFVEAFIDDANHVASVISTVNACPLGSAAGYGVNLPLDRDGVSEALGFDRVQINPMYVQTSRGKFEMIAISALWSILHDIRRLCWDLSLYTTSEFGFVVLPNELTTGSSIMPNKRNPDVIEVLRAVPATIAGCLTEIQNVIALPSGYHRDLQLTKAPLIRAFSTTIEALALIPNIVESMEFDRARMVAAIDRDMFATDEAVNLSTSGVPFREAYQQVSENLSQLESVDPHASLAARVSLGGCANLGLDVLLERLESVDSIA